MDVELIKKFAKFCKKKMGIKNVPKITLTKSRDEITTTAGYKRGKEIIVYTKGRHQVDICRSLAHELKHHKQWEDKEFNNTEKIQDVGGKYEDDANATAGQMIKQFAYDGNMKLYESKQLITEGRVQDAKKQFSTLSDKLIEYVSSKDPSGNNKYLNWILKQIRLEVLSSPDVNVQSLVDGLIGMVIEFNKYLPYIKPGELDVRVLSDKIIKNPKDINGYDNREYLELVNQMMKPIYNSKTQGYNIEKTTEILLDDSKYLIVKINSPKQMCYYGLGTKWCELNFDFWNKYNKEYFIFVVKEKNEDYFDKIVVLINKELKGKYLEIIDGENKPINVEELKYNNDNITELLGVIEMYVEGLKNKNTMYINNDNPQLYALSKYLNDENLSHYKENNFIGCVGFKYNNGKITQNYFINDVENLKPFVKDVYINQFKNNVKTLLRHPELLPQILIVKNLIRVVNNYFGIGGLYVDQDKIKEYYPIPPSKLKTSQLMDNKQALSDLKQLDNDIETVHDQSKRLKKNIKQNKKKISSYKINIKNLTEKIEVLNIRKEQIKNDDKTMDDLVFKLSEYERILDHNTKEFNTLNKLTAEMKTKFDKTLSKYDMLVSDRLDKLNQLEMTYDDKENYEYSNQQIIDAKSTIDQNVISNPIAWIKKLNLYNKKILPLVDLNIAGDIIFDKFKNDVKSFGEYKLIDSVTENKKIYYIFIKEEIKKQYNAK